MTKVGILAMARAQHGGTLLYSRSMIEALSLLPSALFSFVIVTPSDNHEFDDMGLPISRLPNAISVAAACLVGRDPFEAVDVVIAPIHSTILLATRRPFVFTLHDLQEKYYPQYFSVLKRIWRHAINKILTARAKKIVCESKFVRQDIVNFFGIEENKIHVIPAPPVSTLTSSSVSELQMEKVWEKFSLPAQYLFYPAQFWLHKNHLRLVEAFAIIAASFPDLSLVLTGKVRDEHRRVFARVEELGLTSRVIHVGYIETEELAAIYRGATFIVVPTLFESISIPVYEAFALGVPVCASAVVGLPEQVGDAGLLFDPTSVDDIAKTMTRLLDDPLLRQELVSRGKTRVKSVTHEAYARILEHLLNSLTSSLVSSTKAKP